MLGLVVTYFVEQILNSNMSGFLPGHPDYSSSFENINENAFIIVVITVF